MKEIWKNIKDFDGYYISNKGRVKYKKNILNPFMYKNRMVVHIKNEKRSKRKAIHLLVYEYHVKSNKPFVIHIDGNFDNNNATNLKGSYLKEYINNYKIGKEHHKSKPFYAEGKKFYTLRECAEHLNLKNPSRLAKIKSRLMSERRKDYYYV